MSKERIFKISLDKLKKAVAAKFNVSYNDVEIGFDDHEVEFNFEIKKGPLVELISVRDDKIYEALEIDKNDMCLSGMSWDESTECYNGNVKDEDKGMIIEAKEQPSLKEAA